ncbi:MAG: PAS domain-containing protein, partial [Thermodesulfobacteriota bacterium]|nr:PAS domain-containing protein [Thermodesulfobacteriota bacterium]
MTHIRAVKRDMVQCHKKEIEPYAFEEQYSGKAILTDDIILIVQDGVLKFANSAMSTVTHWSAEECIGKDFAKLLSEDSFRKIKEEYEKKMADKEVPHFRKIEIIDNEGNILPVELSAETTEYEGRKAFLFVLRDIA